MAWWLVVVDVLAVVIVLTALSLAVLVWRRWHIVRRLGAFDLSINRRDTHSAQGWVLGLGVYSGDELDWYRTFSFKLTPSHRFVRHHLVIDQRREPTGGESHAVHRGHVIVAAETTISVRQFALSPAALTGLLAWLESAPPGQGVNRVV